MDAAERQVSELAEQIRSSLVESRRAEAAAGRGSPAELPTSVHELVEAEAAVLPADLREEIAARILRDTVGLGPLEELLADPAVEEVMVNGPGQVYAERRGRIEPTEVRFAGEAELRNAIERILAPLGRRVDELSPMVDARL